MNFTKILTFAIITMFLLVPFASAKQEAADSLKQDKKVDEKVIDKTKEAAKEIKNKDKDLTGKVTVTDSNTDNYKVSKDSDNTLRIKKQESGGIHTKTKVTIAKSELDNFTEDITKTTETKGAVYQNVSIIHTNRGSSILFGTIAWELDPLYSGTPVLSSNNTNATASRNNTHVIISTGPIKQGQSFSYAVSVPDDHNHGFHLGYLMKWVGTGWDFVSTPPDDWSNYIGDEIEVTVS